MAEPQFGYQAVLARGESGDVVSLIAFEVRSDAPFRAVIWEIPRQAWVYAPESAARVLFDDRYFDRTRAVTRDEAEQLAREHLGEPLPAEEDLRRMCGES
jgi:transposase